MNQTVNPVINITNQPAPVIFSNPAVLMQPNTGHTIREWSTGLFDCFSDFGECIFGLICPWCHEIALFSKANEECCSCVFGGLVPLRTKIRAERGIRVIK